MMQNILITGSNGRLGGKLVKLLLDKTEFKIIAAASSEEKFVAMKNRENIPNTERLCYLANDSFACSEYRFADLYGAVHLAFARRKQPASQIANSIDFSVTVFKKLAESNVQKIINVSSQGVYGSTEEIRTEETLPAPDNHYTMAKYATEVIFNNVFRKSHSSCYTSLRLDIITQTHNLIDAFCRQAREGELHLRGGDQIFSFLDEQDAVSALLAMLISEAPWETVYNVGWNNKRYSILDVAEITAEAAEESGLGKPEIYLEKRDLELWAGMNSERFMEHTGWMPEKDLKESIKSLLNTWNT